jgi:hypothetical protein
MKALQGSFLNLFTVSGVLLLSGCSPNATTPNSTPPAQTSPGTHSQGGQAGGGAIQAVRGAVERVPDENELKNFALAYTQHALANGDRGPSNVQEIRDSLTPKMVKDFQSDGPYVVNWGIKNPSSNSILAYSKDVDMYGLRMVARGDGAVVRMSKQEFEQAKMRR